MHTEINNIYEHPLFKSKTKLFIETPPIKELRNKVKRLIWTEATGAAIVGFTREGKTTAFKIIRNHLETRSGKFIPVVPYSVHSRDMKTIKSLIMNICTTFNLLYKDRDSAEKLIEILLIYLAEKAKESGTSSILLIIDEAQRLLIKQIDVFAELYDKLLEEYSITLTVIFIGNKEQLSSLIEKITNGKNEHIEGRFFRNYIHFRGLRSKDDVEFCLEQYDILRYPKEGPTYTEFFLPDKYSDGFRMKQLAGSIWSVFSEYQKTLQIQDWGMEYFIRAVNTLITDYLSNSETSTYSDDMFKNCIEVSGLVPGLITQEIE